jgi:circadian clock protein KaiB
MTRVSMVNQIESSAVEAPDSTFRGSISSRPETGKAPMKVSPPIASIEETSWPAGEPEFWELRLYVAGQTPKCLSAFARLKTLCEAHLSGQYSIEVVDLLKNPRLAQEEEIIAIPTVVRRLPVPLRKLIGDLSDTDRTLVGLQLRSRAK